MQTLWDLPVVDDWSAKIASYKDKEQKRFYVKMLAKVQELENLGDSTEGWSNMVNDTYNGLRIDAKLSKDGLQTMRS